MITILVPVIIFFLLLSGRKKSNSSTLSPFEYSGTQHAKTSFDLFGGGLSAEKSIVLLILIITISSIIYFGISYANSNDLLPLDFYQKFRVIDILIEGITVVILVRVIFSLANLKIKPMLIALVLCQLAIFIFHIYQNFLKENTENL